LILKKPQVPVFSKSKEVQQRVFRCALDYLAGLTDSKQTIKYSDLSADESEHLHIYIQLNEIVREKIKSYIDGLRRK